MKFLTAALCLAALAVNAQLQPTNIPARVTLAWDHSPDPKVVGYNIYQGVAPRVYTNMVSVGYTNSATIAGVPRGMTNYFAATCFTATGLESEFSNEVAFYVDGRPEPIIIRLAFGPPAILSGDSEEYALVSVERSADLKLWCELATVNADGTGKFHLIDPERLPVAAYYRARPL